MKIKLFILVGFLFFILMPLGGSSTIKAKESSINKYESINPDSPLYKVKRFWEKLILTTKKGDNRVLYYSGLIEKRLNELEYVVEENKLTQLSETSSRYITFQQKFLLMTDGVSIDKSIIDGLSKHKNILENLRDHYPANSSNWLMLEQTIDSFNVTFTKISQVQ